VNALLVKRMSTLRRDIVHVSELMRDSISRIQDITPATSLGAAGSTRLSDAGLPPSRLSLSAAEVAVPAGGNSRSSAGGVSGPATAAVVPASRLSIDPTSGVGSSGESAAAGSGAGAAEAAALAALELPSPVPASEGLTGVHGIAGLAEQGPSASSSRAATPHQLLAQQQQQQHAVDADGIQLQVVVKQQASSKQRGKLSAVVSEALQQPIPAGAYVVRDVKISRLAGELDM
jgi:hypothetical protein